MNEPTRARRSAATPAPRISADARREAPAIAVLIHLQRSAGNAAVSRYLSELADARPQRILAVDGQRRVYEQCQRAPDGAEPAVEELATVSPFNIVFTTESTPEDHTQCDIGVNPESGVPRLGYAEANVKKAMSLPDMGRSGGFGGRGLLYLRDVTITATLATSILVSSRVRAGSRTYDHVLAHERSHQDAFVQLFNDSRLELMLKLHAALFTVARPTFSNLEHIDEHIDKRRDEVGHAIQMIVKDHFTRLNQVMKADSKAKDAPAAYRAFYRNLDALDIDTNCRQ